MEAAEKPNVGGAVVVGVAEAKEEAKGDENEGVVVEREGVPNIEGVVEEGVVVPNPPNEGAIEGVVAAEVREVPPKGLVEGVEGKENGLAAGVGVAAPKVVPAVDAPNGPSNNYKHVINIKIYIYLRNIYIYIYIYM